MVNLASKLVFFEQFNIVCTREADQACKTIGLVPLEWLEIAANQGLATAECLQSYRETRLQLIPIRADRLRIPERWRFENPGLTGEIASAFAEVLPSGLPASRHQAVVDAIEVLATFLDVVEQGGTFIGRQESVSERELQTALRDHLRMRGVQVQEGLEVGGGETDLVLPGELVVENKVRGATVDPFGSGEHYAWQARRYGIALHSSQVIFTVVCYEAADENAYLPISQRIRVMRPERAPVGHYAQVRVVVPWSRQRPSGARSPRRSEAT